MLLAISASVIVVLVLLWEVAWPVASEKIACWRARRARIEVEGYDPGRERRAEQRARELLRSCVNDEEWAMYRDLGFIRIFGRGTARTRAEGGRAAGATPAATAGVADEALSRPGAVEPARAPDATGAEHRYAYLIYPHKPILAYEPSTRRLLSEYCVEFPDLTDAVTGSRLPESDDVLAKWMALTGDERRLLRDANMHLPGRQLDPGRVRRDLWRLEEWERRRRRSAQAQRR
jgi:hypothetical protein